MYSGLTFTVRIKTDIKETIIMQSSNPALSAIKNAAGVNFGGLEAGATISGTTTKSILLVALTLLVGVWSMNYSISSFYDNGTIPTGLATISCILGLIVCLVTCFKPNFAPVTAPVYAVLEGAALGSISAIFELQYPGLVSSAVMATFAVVLSMLALWKYKVIVPTKKFAAVITSAITGICVLYILDMILGFFHINLIPTSGPLSILISVVVCAVAALSLILDFEQIQQSVDQGLPKHFEYYNAFCLLVTICWLYVEILKLLAKLREE